MAEARVLTCQRGRFSLPRAMHYLNCAYKAPLSERVRAAGEAGIRKEAVPAEIVARDFFSECDEVRRLFARVIGLTEPGRVAIIPAVSYGLATVVRNARVERGQNVVTLHEQFPSNVHAWRRLCVERGANLRVIGPPDRSAPETRAWNEAILEAIDGDTAAVAMGSVHWTEGTRFDIERIGERAREVGALFVIDGTQSVGAEPFDVGRIRPDALVCAGYKWLMGPYSLGVAYYGSRFDDGTPLEETWSGRVGAEDFAGLVDQGDAYRDGAARYDVGEPGSFVLMPMFVAALEQLLEWGVSSVAAYVGRLTDRLFEDERMRHLGLGRRRPDASHLFGLRLPTEVEPARVAARLRRRGVYVSVRGRFVRVSPHVYNDEEDLDALLGALGAALTDS